MGQDIDVIATVASSSKKISMNVSCSAHYAILDSGRELGGTMRSFFMKVSKMFPNETFSTYIETSRDFENNHEDWMLLVAGDYPKTQSAYRIEGNYDWVGERDSPEWEVANTSPLTHYIDLIGDGGRGSSIGFFGFTEGEIQELAIMLANVFDLVYSDEYVQFSKTHCVHQGVVTEISTFPEKIQEDVFGIKPKFKNVTYKLFSWDSSKLAFEMHPELKAVYRNNFRDMMFGYREGEFSLWETAEGIQLYTKWRDGGHGESKYIAYETMLALGIEPIQGNIQKTNLMLEEAQTEFVQDALPYVDGSCNRTMVRYENNMVGGGQRNIVSKMAMVDNGIHEIYFKLEDFYPLGLKVTKTPIEITDQFYANWSGRLGKSVDETLDGKVRKESHWKCRWTVQFDGVTVFDEVK